MDQPINIRRLAFYLTGRMPPYYMEGLSKWKFYIFLHKADPTFKAPDYKRFTDITGDDEELFHLCLEEIELKKNWQELLRAFKDVLKEDYVKDVPDDALYAVSTISKDTALKWAIKPKPIIFTEWKTDALLLKCAWLVLNNKSFSGKADYEAIFDQNAPYRIESCDLNEGVKTEELAGWKRLARVITYWKWESPAIGFFDRDDDGFEALAWIASDKNEAGEAFKKEGGDSDIGIYSFKSQGTKKYAIASPYPIPAHRIGIEWRDKKKDAGAFEVEFYLSDADILKVSPGGLTECDEGWKKYQKLSVSKKASFAQSVLEKQSSLDFSGFEIVFLKVENFLKEMF